MLPSRAKTILCAASLLVASGCSTPLSEFSASALAPSNADPEGHLTIRWFGAAATVIDDGTTSILIDPFVSRDENGPLDIVFGRDAKIARHDITSTCSDPAFGRAAAIFVGHTHYDHSLDIADFANCTGAPVFGTAGAARIVSAHGGPTVTQVANGEHIDVAHSAFSIEVLPGDHGHPPAGFDPLAETVPDPFMVPAPIRSYGLGGIHSYVIHHPAGTILHIGSAGVVPGSYDHLRGRIDVVLMSLVGRPETSNYLSNVVGVVEPRYVIPIHFDDLFRDIDKEPRVVGIAKLDEFLGTLAAKYPNVTAGFIDFDTRWTLPRH